MKRTQGIPVVWLLAGNVLAVLLLISVGNFWWWKQLSHLDEDIKTAVSASSASKVALLDLVNRQVPLNQLLSKSALYTTEFIDELELLVLDASRDYNRLKTLRAKLQKLDEQVQSVWLKTIDPDLLIEYRVNLGIILDIIYEVLETTSPNQLQLLAEDSEETLSELLKVMERINQHSAQLLTAAEQRVLEVLAKTDQHVTRVDNVLTQILQQNWALAVFGSLLIMALQWLLFRTLRRRLSGLAAVMRQIAASGSLEQRVENAREGDLIGNIILIFNNMLDRLQTTRQALQEEKQRAEAATQAKSNFLANMSHEIRTPVHAITSLVHLMREQRMPPRIERYASKVEVASEALLHVINDVLDFSKVVEGKLELDNDVFSLPLSMEKLIDVFSSKFNEKGLDLVLYLEPGVPNKVVGDRLRLNQILINLINNAFKFTSAGSVSVRVASGQRSGSEISLLFEVNDTGIGIDHARIGQLFEAFSQADASTTRKYGGTGLGLSISKRLSALMGGDIQVASDPGQGSTFTLTVTFERADQAEEPFIPTLPETVHQQQVLLVCPPGDQQKMLEQTLRAWQLQPTTLAAIGQYEQTLPRLLDKRSYQLLLIDAPEFGQRPLETYLQELSGYEELWSLPVIFLSHRGLKEETAREVHVVDRPVKPSELFNALSAALKLPDLQVANHNASTPSRKERQHLQERLAGARILVVEDVAINQQIAKEILNRAGFHVRIAENGREALKALENTTFDLVLMDLQMPVMGGLEATRAIRERSELAQLPVIAMTANVIKGVVEQCLEAGCNDYLSKPLDMDELWRVLAQWIPAGERTPYVSEMTLSASTSGEVDAPLPDQLPGIEVAVALARLGGNLTLYRKLLEDFLHQYSDVVQRLCQLVQERDYAGCSQLAHGLKGVASNLGILDVSLTAQAVEHLARDLRQEKELDTPYAQSLDSSLEELRHHLARATHSIDQIIQTSAPAPEQPCTSATAPEPVEYTQIKPQLAVLAQLIGDSDADALDHFEQLKPLLVSNGLSDLADQLESHLNSFSFEDAYKVLSSLQQDVDIKESEPYG